MIKFIAFAAMLLAIAPADQHSAAPVGSGTPAPKTLSPEELFSRRALRQARLILQMRLLQLRDERLDCIRAALLRQLPDALWQEEPTPSRGSRDAASAASRCAQLIKF